MDEEILILYIQFLSRNFKSVSSVKNYVFGLQTLSLFNLLHFPDLGQPVFKYQFKGITRSLSHKPTRASPLSPIILLQIFQHLDLTNPIHVNMWAVMVVGFFLFARIGNLLPKSKFSYNPNTQLSRSDVRVAEDCVVVTLKYTKTIQNGERYLQVPLSHSPGSPLCPKSSLLRMVQLSPGSPTDHLFSYNTRLGKSVITQSEFTQFLRSILSKCGYESNLFSGHSLRRGGATWAFSKGVKTEMVKHHGDWKSDAYLVYIEFSMSQKLETTQLMLS